MKIKSLGKALLIAQQIFKNRNKIKDVFNESTQKAEAQKEAIPTGLWGDVKMLLKMLKAWQAGTYKFSKKNHIVCAGWVTLFSKSYGHYPRFYSWFRIRR